MNDDGVVYRRCADCGAFVVEGEIYAHTCPTPLSSAIDGDTLGELRAQLTDIVGWLDARGAFTNPFRAGDWVRLTQPVKDAYCETWHEAGDTLRVDRIADDGDGLMFASDLGIHWTCVRRADGPEAER